MRYTPAPLSAKQKQSWIDSGPEKTLPIYFALSLNHTIISLLDHIVDLHLSFFLESFGII